MSDEDVAARLWGRYEREWKSFVFRHVIPLDDIKEHDPQEASGCWCGPRRDDMWATSWWGHPILLGIQWVHNALDGREDLQ